MKFYDLVTKKTYTSNGEEKVRWQNVGTLRENDDGKKFVELSLIPDQTIYVFDQKERADWRDSVPENIKSGNSQEAPFQLSIQ